MKFLAFMRKVWRTVPLVQHSLPLVLDELKDLTGETRKFVVKLKEIWAV
jgi:hypothetical protein